MGSVTLKFKDRFFAPVDASFLAVFRIGFGLIMLWEVYRYWSTDWIADFYITPQYHFKYYGFEWVQPWEGHGMYVHFAVMGVLALFICAGFLYRISAILFALAFTYIFLLEQAYYLNHFYMVILFCILLIILPAQRSFSIDALINPRNQSYTVPVWTLWLLRAQVEIILIYAGLVKINSDWLHLEPLSMWLATRGDFPVLGYLFTQEWAVAVAAYGVIILHLIGAPLLLWKKTRLYVFCIYAAFHTLNHFVFSIGIFPWLTLFVTLVFFDPNWPKQFYARLHNLVAGQRADENIIQIGTTISTHHPLRQRYWTYGFLSIWLGLQILIPLRHWIYPGNVSWTEQGHRFAWQMKLRDKKGLARFYVMDPRTGETTTVNPRTYLNKRQTRKMATHPDMILQFAHYLRDHWATTKGIENPIITVDAFASLNGREPARLIDGNKNLATVQRNLAASDWILPIPSDNSIKTSALP